MLKRLSSIAHGLTRKHRPRTLPVLWVMSEMSRLPDPGVLIDQLPPGAAIIIRHTDAAQRRALAARILPRARARRIKVLISQDWRAALSLRLDGVHLPERDVRRLPITKRLLVSASAHDARALRRAAKAKCDIVFLSPVLPTRSHPERAALGRLRFAMMAQRARTPVGALGGINHATLRALNGARVSAIAGVSFV